MKLNVLYVKKLPISYKQCAQATALHLCIQEEEKFIEEGDQNLRKKYLTYIKESICEEIKNANMVARPDMVKVNGEYFVLFKSNIDKRMLATLIKNLLLECNEYTDNLLTFAYSTPELMIMEEGKDPTILGSLKMGEDYFKANQDEKLQFIDTKAAKSRTKYFKSFQEYKNEKETTGYDYYI